MPSSGRDWGVKWSHDVFTLKLAGYELELPQMTTNDHE